MGETILELQNIAKHFGDTDVLNGISISIGKGEFITLLGPSGCGKTTTLRIIAGLETPDEGRVILNGQDVTDSEPNKRDVNTVFQNCFSHFPLLIKTDWPGRGPEKRAAIQQPAAAKRHFRAIIT